MSLRPGILIAAMFLLAGCQPPLQPVTQAPLQTMVPYTQAASGMVFPPAVGEFRRTSVNQYDAAGRDVSANYALTLAPSDMLIATIYVYPAPPQTSIGASANVAANARETLCNGEFQKRKRELTAVNPSARLIKEGNEALPHGGPPNPGKVAIYEYTGPFGNKVQPLHSELHVFCFIDTKWMVKYRFTSPQRSEMPAAISTFMTRLPWTIGTGS